MTLLEAEMDKYGFVCEKDTFTNIPGHIAEILYAERNIAIGFTNLKTKEFHLFKSPINNKLK